MSRNINFLRHDVEKNCLKLIEMAKRDGYPVLVTCSTRTDAEQLEAYKSGHSNAKTPSFHAKHAGLAFDICKNVKGQEYSDNAFWGYVGKLGKSMGFTWGGDWKSLVDKPHFQWDGGGKYTSAMIRNKQYPPEMPPYEWVEPEPKPEGATPTVYRKENGIHICEVDIKNFSVEMCNEKKKDIVGGNYCNAGFFGTYKENGVSFTLPVGHTVCDFTAKEALVKKYCTERGRFITPTKYQFDASKWAFDSPLYGKAISTLIVSGGAARITDISPLPNGLDYAISGVPIMRNGADVAFNTYVRGQGWSASSLYGTWHIFIGLKQNDPKIYVMGMKTTSGNMILAAEAYHKFKALGMHDVIKLDGGGSFHLDVDGKAVASTSENRLINTILRFGPVGANKSIPTVVLKNGSRGEDVKTLQSLLNANGFNCGTADGVFGANTEKAVRAFQAANKLIVDGMVGSQTWGALTK